MFEVHFPPQINVIMQLYKSIVKIFPANVVIQTPKIHNLLFRCCGLSLFFSSSPSIFRIC